jgi:hypothetical protein
LNGDDDKDKDEMTTTITTNATTTVVGRDKGGYPQDEEETINML